MAQDVALVVSEDGAQGAVLASALAEFGLVADAVSLPGTGSHVGLKAKSDALHSAWAVNVEEAVAKRGQLNFLVNILPPLEVTDVRQTDLTALHRLELDQIVNPWCGLKHGLAKIRNFGGSIITVSVGAIGGGEAATTAMRNALRMMSQCAALECAREKPGVRIHSVFADTSTPAQRLATTVTFLTSARSSFVTGSEISLSSRTDTARTP